MIYDQLMIDDLNFNLSNIKRFFTNHIIKKNIDVSKLKLHIKIIKNSIYGDIHSSSFLFKW